MNQEEIRAFQEKDREYLRARRQADVGVGKDGSARTTIGSSALPQSQQGEVRVTWGTDYQQRYPQNGLSSTQNEDDQKKDQDNDEDEDEEDGEEPICLSQSTHSFLFTEPICSLPFWFALIIAAMSYACLLLAMMNTLSDGEEGNQLNVPVQVSKPVRGAQYLSLVIGLLMEEEIPTGLLMLRMIPKKSLKSKFPKMNFWRFLFSAAVRIVMGYIFLLNMFLVVVQATAVIDIFYDVLALQFVQQFDDICFGLAKMDVLGNRLKTAAIQKCFRVEFERMPLTAAKRKGYFLKSLYFINIFALLTGMVIVNTKQDAGGFQCDSITVEFGNEIWEDAISLTPDGEIDRAVLVFSYFNGVYKRNGTHDGRPVYTEQNKFDSSPFKTTMPAEIKYCASEEAWVFTHARIRKATKSTDEDECPWLLKSGETTEFNLLEVSNNWHIWTGTISTGAELSTVCDACNQPAECNYHGECVEEECVCNSEDGWFGTRCEHKTPCPLMIGDKNDTYSLAFVDEQTIFKTYDRPVYSYLGGLNTTLPEDDSLNLVYSGSRWLGMVFKGGKRRTDDNEFYWVEYASEFHAFWNKAYDELTQFVSDPTSGSSPVSADFYLIGERDEQYGPFGQLWPVREPKGSGYYRCENNSTIVTEVYNKLFG